MTKIGKTVTRAFVCPNISLNITQKLIDSAERGNKYHCMIARALREWAKKNGEDIWSIEVTAENVRFNLNDDTPATATRYSYPLPASAAIKLKAWDEEGLAIKPFKVTLAAKQGYVRPVTRKVTRRYEVVTDAKTGRKTRIEIRSKRHRKPEHRRCARRFAGLATIEKAGGHVTWRNKTRGMKAA